MSAIDKFLDALRLNPDEDYADDYEDDDYGFDEPDEPDERELKRQAARERKAALKEQKAREREELQAEKERQRQEEKERRRIKAEEAEKLRQQNEAMSANSYPQEKTVTSFRTAERPVERSYEKSAVRSQSKITPMTSKPSARKQSFSMDEVCVIKPTNFQDETEITDTILSGKPVIINMEGLDVQVAQRIVDFTLGATYAINGNFQRITNYIFLATPNGVDISGDINAESNLSF